MEIKPPTDFLIHHIQYNISSFETKKENNKTKAFWMQVAVTTISALLGVKWAGKEDLTCNTALILTSGVTVISAADEFFNHKKLWMNYNETLNRLYALKFDLDFRLSGQQELAETEQSAYKADYRAILDETYLKWQKLRQSPVNQEAPIKLNPKP